MLRHRLNHPAPPNLLILSAGHSHRSRPASMSSLRVFRVSAPMPLPEHIHRQVVAARYLFGALKSRPAVAVIVNAVPGQNV